MFDAQKFGRRLSKLRKQADMTQSELAEKLNVTRQAVSHYELGESFPDVSILILISNIFGVSLDSLISYGEPTDTESKILSDVARGKDSKASSIDDILGLAPYLKPSVLEKLSATLSVKGIDISNIIALAEYLSDESVVEMLKNADFSAVDNKLLEKLLPILDWQSKNRVFQMVLEGEIDWRMIKALCPFIPTSLIEAAVLQGCLPWEALELVRQVRAEMWEKQKNEMK